MKEKKRPFFPILLKVIVVGLITSFIASTVAIVVNYHSMLRKGLTELDEGANEALEYAYSYFDDFDDDALNFSAFEYVRDYVLKCYGPSSAIKNAELKNYPNFADYEDVFVNGLPYFYAEGMFMTQDYPDFRNNLNTVYQFILNASFYSELPAYYAFKDPNDSNRLIFFGDSRLSTYKTKNIYYHCPGSHYDIKPTDNIHDIGHEYIKGYTLDKYETRFVELLAKDVETGEKYSEGYIFIEYETNQVAEGLKPILLREILIMSATGIAVVLLYSILSYLLFVKNINKLNKVAVGISEQLSSSKQFKVVEPNIKSNDEMKTLADSFDAMENQLVNYVEIIKNDAREKEKINAELDIASKIQLEALPNANFDNDKVSIRAFIKPAKEVGGDFYDYFYIDDNRLAIIISDVSGKGIPASLFMMKSKELLKSQLVSGNSLVESVTEANEILYKNNNESLFVTSFIGVIDFKKEEIRYINSGHEKPYIISNGKLIKLEGNSNFVLGGMDGIEYKQEKHPLRKGDMLFMFTDGLNESINNNEEEFSYKRIEDTLEKSMNSSLDDIIINMRQELDNFVGKKEAFDDVTMIIAKLSDGTLSLSFDKKDPSIIEEAVNQFEKAYPYLDSEKKSKVGIILDELLNNFVSYEKRADLHIDINFSNKEDTLKIEIITNGDDYDPFKNNKKKYLNDFSHELEEGGFGVTLVENLSKSTKYSYKNGHSHLIIEI